MVYNLFLFGEDEIDDIKAIRKQAVAAFVNGRTVEWSSQGVTYQKVQDMPLHVVIAECDYFLRCYDPTIKLNNPIITDTIPFLYYT